MDTLICNTLMQVLPKWEGVADCLYIDTASNVTTGVGHLLSSLAAASQIPWVPITALASDWNRIITMPPGLSLGVYRNATTVRLPVGWAVTDAVTRLETEYLPAARRAFGVSDDKYAHYDDLPLPAQVVILDMAYNLGEAGLAKYRHFISACHSGDWGTAAANSTRHGIQTARNDWARATLKGIVS